MSRRTPKPGIVRVKIDGVSDYSEQRIGNAERFTIAMRRDRSDVIVVDADTPEMAEALAVNFWRSNRLGGRPNSTIIQREILPPPPDEAWQIAALQDEIERAERIGEDTKAERDRLIRKSAKVLRPVQVAEVTGLTKSRISQILHTSE